MSARPAGRSIPAGRGSAPIAPSGTRWSQESAAPTVFSQKHDLSTGGRAVELVGLDAEVALPMRISTGIAEFDRAIGGGIVPGSAMLLAGDPGIGKSTLLLQVAAAVALSGKGAVYVSGEEAVDQVRLRALRLGLGAAPVKLASVTSVRDILTTLQGESPPALLVIDSVQTMHSDLIEGAPGTVSQVRASGAGTDPLRQGTRHGADPGRPRHQGRQHRGAARARAYGRRGARLRRRAQPPVSHPARGQEPVRRDRRDRRVRDGRRGAGRGAEPERAVPDPPRRSGQRDRRSSRRWKARGRCWSRSRR